MAAVAANVRAHEGVVVGVRSDDRRDGASEDSFVPGGDARFAAARAKLGTTHGDKLSCEPLTGRKGCRIAAYHQGDIANTDQWDDYVEWFVAAQTWLRQAIATIGGLNNVIAP